MLFTFIFSAVTISGSVCILVGGLENIIRNCRFHVARGIRLEGDVVEEMVWVLSLLSED